MTILEQDLTYKDIVDWKSIESLEAEDADGPQEAKINKYIEDVWEDFEKQITIDED